MSGKMAAQIFYEANQMRLEEIGIPEISDAEVLIKVKNVGICGSDVSYYFGWSPVNTPSGKGPIVLGHEFSGEIVEVGAIPKTKGLFKVGDRVVVNPVQPCNACYDCAAGNTHVCRNVSITGVSTNGAMAEYCASNYTSLFRLAPSISYASGALIEPLACAVNGLTKLDIEAGQFVGVFGPGPIGLMMVKLAKSAFGAGRVLLVGTRDYRLDAGKKAGADLVFNDTDPNSNYYVQDLKRAVIEATDGRLPDRIIVATGSDHALTKAVDLGANCSIIVHFGLPDKDGEIRIPALAFHTADKQIRSAWLAPLSWPKAIRCVEEKLVDLESLVSHRAKLNNAEGAIIALKERDGSPMKYELEIS